MIRKILIANRGEIAVRVIRTARAMGIRTVAVYSDADAGQRHVALADEAVCIGPPAPSESYLSIPAILGACADTGADAVHPGYGFLSENADFTEACETAGITFIGPTAAAMRKLGSKIDAKRIAVEADVPVTPGYFQPGATAAKLKAEADKIGYPVMLKASAGGGGRGMRVVHNPDDFDAEFSIAADEALKGFGDDAMMIEKLVEWPRHVEVQVLADTHGNVAALFERECSIQRRHQKLFEESPSPYLAARPDLWESMRDAAVALARAAGYTNAGTCEFIVDVATGKFYFLEVNARLQVEHPVTETITGLDLVALQIRVAQGQELDLSADLAAGSRHAMNGHAIEARIVAEDPAHGFMPSSGRILGWAPPEGPGIRFDTGYGPGCEVPRHYDSLLAKVIAHGADRTEAIARLRSALLDFHVLGVKTNIGYMLDVLSHPEFVAGRLDTGFLGRHFADWAPPAEVPPELGVLVEAASTAAKHSSDGPLAPSGAWSLDDDFRNVRYT